MVVELICLWSPEIKCVVLEWQTVCLDDTALILVLLVVKRTSLKAVWVLSIQ